MDRIEMTTALAESLTNSGVPPLKVHKCVQAVLATLSDVAIEDSIAGLVDKRINALKQNIDAQVTAVLEKEVRRMFNHQTMQNLVSAEAQKQTKVLYEFMYMHAKPEE